MNGKVGFVGLGKMGMPMARNLVKSSYTVYGFDSDERVLKDFENFGGHTGKLIDWIQDVDYIIFMLPSSEVVSLTIDEIISTFECANVKKSLTVIDMSTSYPLDTKNNHKKLQKMGIQLLDAPVSGGVKKAKSASLTIMVGGSNKVYQNCKRLLSALGSHIFYIGPSGSGHFIKVMNNYLSAVHLLASCEAVQLLEAYSIHPETAIRVINQSTGRSASTEYKFPSFILSESYDSAFSLELMKKDIGMAKELFADIDGNTTLPASIFQRFHEASLFLGKEADHTEIFQYVSTYLLTRGTNREKSKKKFSGNTDPGVNF